jgi:transcription-repair coupling factor (superfamily II helicase)
MLPSLPSLPVTPGQSLELGHVPFAAQALVLAQFARSQTRPIVHVCVQDKDCASLMAMLQFIAPEIERYYLPAWDVLPYDRVSPSLSIQSQRLATLGALALHEHKTPYIVLTTLNAASQYLPPRSLLARASFSVKRGDILDRPALLQFLNDHGYRHSGKVMEAGEYAVRGSLIDLFPAGADEAVRIDLFGDEVESLKSFDPMTQLSAAPLEKLLLQPVSEVLLQPAMIERFRTRYRDLFHGTATQDDPLYEAISAGRTYPGMEHWLPLYYEQLSTLENYCPNAILSSDYRIGPLQEERAETIADYYEARRAMEKSKDGGIYHPVPPEQLFLSEADFNATWNHHPRLKLTPFAPTASGLSLGFQSAPQLHQRKPAEGMHVGDVVSEYLNHKTGTVILAASSFGSAERIKKILKLPESLSPVVTLRSSLVGEPKSAQRDWVGGEASTLSPHQNTTHFDSPTRGECLIELAILPIEHGFEAPELTILTEQDMFGEKIIRTTRKKKKSETFMQEATSLLPGEIIVHREHGIGKFEGLTTVEVGTTRHDCLMLVYDGGKLFLPVENIDLISRFGHSDGPVPLDKLGGVAWQKRKSALKKRLRMAAEALLKVAAERAAKPAPSLVADAGAYDEFCARFPYSETDDQQQAIDDVKADLAKGHAMDRLICGDVGFGKTEVALRAAFISASAGVQVAIIAPTTLLARQHFATFRERFRDLPFTVRMLSRLTPAKDTAETKKQLPEGKVDIVIGTHALLAAGVQFKKLGLLVVDEEQHFGVAQKEKLKALKSDIHVLTLSATPIPRTLQMSLSGVRELSLITTPPIDRLAVRSYVMPYDPVILREAMLREHHRGGKTFYVTPRIKYMAELEQKIRALVPEVKIIAAHGQMAPMALDKAMNDFYDGKYDVLLSTAIIESGIDIPTANTMIIDHAEMLGLAQLYQLRGRVGRSKTRAYAYLTLPHGKKLTREAERRLEVMQQLDSLGAGFALASHDMDIRGFGNLLGEEQSGHIKEVGIELYQTMLEEAIADLRRKRMPNEAPIAEAWSPQLNLGMSVLIPETYIADLPLRLSLYRRAASLENQSELDAFADELADRFGSLPAEVEALLAVLSIKILAKKAGVARMDAGPKGVVVAFKNNQFAAPEALLAHIAKHHKRIKLRADQTLFIAIELSDDGSRLKAATEIATEIAELLPKAAVQAA